MIIDETFMWLYAAYKIGKMCAVLTVVSLLSLIPFITMVGENCEEKNLWYKLGIKGIVAVFISAMVCVPIATITPDVEEVKAYAAYAIGKDVVTSDEAKALFNSALKYIDGQTTKQ